MTKKYGKIVTLALIVVLAVAILIQIIIYASVPRLPRREKEKVEAAYYVTVIPNPGRPDQYPLIWYDENGGVEEDWVWRYIGTYGDCYAFLQIGDNINAIMTPCNNPYRIRGFDREVYYHTEANVILYHTEGYIYKDGPYGYYTPMIHLFDLSNSDREEWITDKQLQQLARDIEAISKVD